MKAIEGNRCPRGETYAQEEITDPKRLFPELMALVRALSVEVPVEIGQVLVPNLLGTGAKLLATRRVQRASNELHTRLFAHR
ncbi:MAG: DUF1667 domain-containing protein [Candidatus Bipolaricaulota bacterium]|nr:DUF1667 domain-containing protein [Candidatus Bipolaricaulota bacterium]MDW8126570.1 DUF1667 domain-containing protein [Candidatus Bipolaricaulota bacterium]